MRDESYAERAAGSLAAERRVAFANVGRATQAIMLACNALPLLTVVASVCVGVVTPGAWPWRVLAGVGFLYVVPAVVCRGLLAVQGPMPERNRVGERAFLLWWATSCLQVLYGRFPALEEGLRLVPGLYTLWLRLWGSRVGRRTYWAPGTAVMDRSFLVIGDDVVLGSGVRLNPHVLDRDAKGDWWLLLAPVRIGDRSMVGGYSLLTAGTEIAADEVTTATVISPPFSVWRGGKRRKRRPLCP